MSDGSRQRQRGFLWCIGYNASVRVTVNNLDSGASVVLDGKTASDIYCKDAGNIEGYGEGVNVDDILLAYVAQVGDVFFTNFADAIAAAMSTVPPATIVVIGDPSGMTAPEGWTFLTDAASGVVTLANLPTAVVTRLSDAEVESDGPYHVVELTDDVDHPEYVCDLKPAFCYTFESVGGETPLDDWYVDYTISFNRDVARNSMGLTGNYNIPEGSPFFVTGDVNLGFFAKDAVAAGVKVPLLNYLTTLSNWTYRQVRENVGTFKCGAFNLSTDNVGTKMTVELRLFAPTMTPEEIRDSSTWVEGVNTFVVASVTETFTADKIQMIPAAVPTPSDEREWPMLWYAGTASASAAIPAGTYHLSNAAFVQTEAPVAVSVPTAYFNVPLKLEPGQSFGTISKEESEAVLAAAGGNNIIAIPAAVADTVADQDAYKNMFEGVVIRRGGNWFVAVVMTEATSDAVRAAVNQAIRDIPLAVAATNDTAVFVAARKGLYYSVLFTSDLRGEWTEGSRRMATDSNVPDGGCCCDPAHWRAASTGFASNALCGVVGRPIDTERNPQWKRCGFRFYSRPAASHQASAFSSPCSVVWVGA